MCVNPGSLIQILIRDINYYLLYDFLRCECVAPSSLWLIPCKETVVWIPEVSYKVSSGKSVIIYWIINNYLQFGYPAPSSPWLIPWIECLWIPIILRQLFCSNKDVRQGRGSVAGWGLVAKRGGFVTSHLMRAQGLRRVTWFRTPQFTKRFS